MKKQLPSKQTELHITFSSTHHLCTHITTTKHLFQTQFRPTPLSPTSPLHLRAAINPTAGQFRLHVKSLHVESLHTSTNDLFAAPCAHTPTNRRSSVVCKSVFPVQRTRRSRSRGRGSGHCCKRVNAPSTSKPKPSHKILRRAGIVVPVQGCACRLRGEISQHENQPPRRQREQRTGVPLS